MLVIYQIDINYISVQAWNCNATSLLKVVGKPNEQM